MVESIRRPLPWHKPESSDLIIATEKNSVDGEAVRFKRLLRWIGRLDSGKIACLWKEMSTRGFAQDAISLHVAVQGLLNGNPPRLNEALEIVEQSLEKNCEVWTRTVNSVLLRLSHSIPPDVAACERLVSRLGDKADIASFGSLLTSYSLCTPPSVKSAMMTLHNMECLGMTADLRAATSIMSACAKVVPPMNNEELSNIMKVLKLEEACVDAVIGWHVCRAWIRCPEPQFSQAEKILSHLRNQLASGHASTHDKFLLRAHSVVLWAYATAGSSPLTESALSLLQQMELVGMDTSIPLFSEAMVVVYARDMCVDRALALFRSIRQSDKYIPHYVVVSTLMTACVESNHLGSEELELLVRDMQQTKWANRSSFYSGLIKKFCTSIGDHCLSSAETKHVQTAIHTMIKTLLSCSPWTESECIASVVTCYISESLIWTDLDNIKEVVHGVQGMGVLHRAHPGISMKLLKHMQFLVPYGVYCEEIEAVARSLLTVEHQSNSDTYQHSSGAGLKKSALTFAVNAILSSWMLHAQPPKVPEASELLNQYFILGIADVVSFNTFLSGLDRWNSVEAANVAQETLARLTLSPSYVKPNTYTYNNVLKILASTHREKECTEFLEQMCIQGVANTSSFNTVIAMYAKTKPPDTTKLAVIMRKMLELTEGNINVAPDITTLNMLLLGYQKDSLQLTRIIKKFQSLGVNADTRSYNMLLASFLNKHPIPSIAVQNVIKEMKIKGIQQNNTTESLLKKLRNNLARPQKTIKK